MQKYTSHANCTQKAELKVIACPDSPSWRTTMRYSPPVSFLFRALTAPQLHGCPHPTLCWLHRHHQVAQPPWLTSHPLRKAPLPLPPARLHRSLPCFSTCTHAWSPLHTARHTTDVAVWPFSAFLFLPRFDRAPHDQVSRDDDRPYCNNSTEIENGACMR